MADTTRTTTAENDSSTGDIPENVSAETWTWVQEQDEDIDDLLNESRLEKEYGMMRLKLINEFGRQTETPVDIIQRLLLDDSPRSYDELAEEIGVSKRTVSTYANNLEDIGVIDTKGLEYCTTSVTFVSAECKWAAFQALAAYRDFSDDLGEESVDVEDESDDEVVEEVEEDEEVEVEVDPEEFEVESLEAAGEPDYDQLGEDFGEEYAESVRSHRESRPDELTTEFRSAAQ